MELAVYRFELTPNCAMSADEARWFFALIAGTSLIVAGFFASQGFWPILPFAGLELAALGWALSHHWRKAQAWESIEIDETDVTVTRWHDADNVASVLRMPRAWTRAALRKQGNQLDLALERGRQRLHIGNFLIDSEKQALQQRISQVLRQTSYTQETTLEFDKIMADKAN